MDDVTINKLKGKGDTPFDTETQVIVGGTAAGSEADGAVERMLAGDSAIGDEEVPLTAPDLDGQEMNNEMVDEGTEMVEDVGDSLVDGLTEPAESLVEMGSSFGSDFFSDEGAASSAVQEHTDLGDDDGLGDLGDDFLME